MQFTEAQLKPVLTADGRKWCQNCYVCNKQIDFLKQTAGVEYLNVSPYVRHKKCYPPAVIK